MATAAEVLEAVTALRAGKAAAPKPPAPGSPSGAAKKSPAKKAVARKAAPRKPAARKAGASAPAKKAAAKRAPARKAAVPKSTAKTATPTPRRAVMAHKTADQILKEATTKTTGTPELMRQATEFDIAIQGAKDDDHRKAIIALVPDEVKPFLRTDLSSVTPLPATSAGSSTPAAAEPMVKIINAHGTEMDVPESVYNDDDYKLHVAKVLPGEMVLAPVNGVLTHMPKANFDPSTLPGGTPTKQRLLSRILGPVKA